MVLAVLVLEELEPLCGDLRQVGEVAVDVLNLGLDAGHELVGLVLVELKDALHLDFQKAEDVVLRHLAHHLGIVWRQAVVDVLTDGVDVGSLLEFLVLIDALLDEDFLQRAEVQLFEEFALTDLQFLSDEVLGAVGGVAQHVADGEELRFVVLDDATVGRDVDFAVGEGVECIERLV